MFARLIQFSLKHEIITINLSNLMRGKPHHLNTAFQKHLDIRKLVKSHKNRFMYFLIFL